jgi:5'-nucleotidase
MSADGREAPLVLITNDDGVAAPGLRHLATAVRDHGMSVIVAAPRQEASGTSASLTAVTSDGRVVFERTSLPGLDDIPAYGVAASPSYIVVLAGLGAFGARPTVVLSGINRGANAGHAILHSGTVGAALTAANNGARAMAVSLDVLTAAMASSESGGAAIAAIDLVDDETRHWTTAATLAGRLLPWLLDSPPGLVLNINVPDRPLDELAGVRHATLAPFGQVQMAVAETGEDFIRTAIEEIGARQVPGTDVALLADGYATVSPIRPPSLAPEINVPLDQAETG